MDGQDWYYIGIVMWLWPCPMEQNKNILILMTDLFSVQLASQSAPQCDNSQLASQLNTKKIIYPYISYTLTLSLKKDFREMYIRKYNKFDTFRQKYNCKIKHGQNPKSPSIIYIHTTTYEKLGAGERKKVQTFFRSRRVLNEISIERLKAWVIIIK